MANSEILLRRIFGAVRADIRPFAHSVNIVEELLFDRGYSMDDILITKHVYPEAAKLLDKNPRAIAKSVERLTRICWDAMSEQKLVSTYIGRSQSLPPTARDMLVYLAVYNRTGYSFFEIAHKHPCILFHSPLGMNLPEYSQHRIDSYAFDMDIAPLLWVVKMADKYAIVPICRACMEFLDEERRFFCNNCRKCKDYGFSLSEFAGSRH